MSWRKLLIAAMAAGVLLRAVTMYTLPLVDPSEGRYIASAAEILRTGDWLVPHVFVQGEPVPYLGKPPLELWFSAGAMALGGMHPFWARVPSFIAMFLMLVFLYRVLRRYEDEDFALATAGICATTPGFLALAGIGMPDTMLSAAVGAGYCAYYAFLQAPAAAQKKRWSLLVFLFAAAGFMCKGPVALVFIGLPALAWTVRWRRWDTLAQHAWLAGVPLFLLITAPWFVLCERAHPGFIRYFFINENLLRFLQPEFGDRFGQGHQQYFGAAIAFAIALGLPWSLWGAWIAVRKAGRPAACAVWQSPALSFFVLVVGMNVLFWCLCRNYLPTYLLPLLPAMSVAAAAVFRAAAVRWRTVARCACACAIATGAAGLILPLVVSDFSSLTAGKLALAETAGANDDVKICWIRKIPNSAFFYFRDTMIVPPHAEELEKALPWLMENSQHIFIAQKKHVQVLPPEIQSRINLLNHDGRWVIFSIHPPAQ